MKKTRILITLIIVIFAVYAWFSKISSVVSENNTYSAYLVEAESLRNNRLYQKAISSYEEALNMEETYEVRKEWIEAYELAFEDGSVSQSNYSSALQTMCSKYPQYPEYWETLLQIQLDNKKYDNAYSILQSMLKTSVTSDTLETLKVEILYSFINGYRSYDEVYYTPKVGYVVFDGDDWGLLENDGEEVRDCNYMYISPLNSAGEAVYINNDSDTRLFDFEGVVEALTDESIFGEWVLDGDNAIYDSDAVIDMDDEEADGLEILTTDSDVTDEEIETLSDDMDSLEDDIYEDEEDSEEGLGELDETDAEEEFVNLDEPIVSDVKTEETRMRAYNNDLLPVKTQDGWCYYSFSNGYVLGPYEDASSYSEGVSLVKENGVWKFIDGEGSIAYEPNFDDVLLYENGDYNYGNIMVAAQNQKYGVYDKSGNLLIDLKAVNADIYMGGYIAFEDDSGLWGFVDTEGNIVIEPQHVGAKSFSYGLAAVYDGQYWGFITRDNKVVIDYQFLDAGYFNDEGICMVSMIEGQQYSIQLRFN